MHVIEQMRVLTLSERRPIMLHFTTVEVIEPAAALVLVAEIDRLRHHRGQNSVTGTYPNHSTIYELLCDMGFYSLLQIAEMGDRTRGGKGKSVAVLVEIGCRRIIKKNNKIKKKEKA